MFKEIGAMTARATQRTPLTKNAMNEYEQYMRSLQELQTAIIELGKQQEKMKTALEELLKERLSTQRMNKEDEADLIDLINDDIRQEIEQEYEYEKKANQEDEKEEIEVRSQTIQDQEQKWGEGREATT